LDEAFLRFTGSTSEFFSGLLYRRVFAQGFLVADILETHAEMVGVGLRA
jgi:hypothetical protein